MLRELDTRLAPDASCTDLAPRLDLCTAARGGQACTGDSGGPLVRRARNGWRLVGITSRPRTPTATPSTGRP
jgi:snapalysin